MLEKSCQWWPILYLLFFCHGAEGELQWVVKEKVTAYGQNLTLFCPVDNCCSEPAGWSVGSKTIIIDVRTFSNDPKVKYHGTFNKDGFGVVIRNLSEADLNVTYRCIYGFDLSIPEYLLHGDVFRENAPDKDKEIDTAAMYKIVVPIAVIMVGFMIGMAYCVRSRTDEEKKDLCNSDIEMKNQQGIEKRRQKQPDVVESMRTKCVKNEEDREGKHNLEEEIMKLKQQFADLKTKCMQPNNRKIHIAQIEKWKIEDKLFYDETRGFTAVSNMVNSKDYMTIIGGPCSGKTATVRHIALQLEKKEWEVVPVCNLEQIIQYGDRDRQQVFVLDDVLGIFAVNMNIYDIVMSYQEQINILIGGTSKLLFTCRKSVYKEAKMLKLFVTENIIDLHSEDNQLSETEKMAICQYHCNSKGVNPDIYASLSFTKANHMFPFLCKIFSGEAKYQGLGESFFNKPFIYFISELDKLQQANRIQYAVLVLCLINNSKLSIECLPNEHMQEVFKTCGVNLDSSEELIKDAICNMSETYFTKLNTEYTFSHDFIFEAIAFHYGHQNDHQSKNQQQKLILKYLSSSYIANKLTVYKPASNEDLCIHISEDMYLPLAERLYSDIQSMNLFDVFMNKSLKHRPFLDVFKGMLKTKPFDEFESLILRKFQNIPQFVKTFSARKPNTEMKEIIENDHLQVLFGTSCTAYRMEKSFNIRVISWIINYGHIQLLQEIVKKVECSKHSISLIFGSNVMENTRLLVLGCYSNTLDMVELILKYVDPKCINRDFTFYGLIGIENITPLIAGCGIGNSCIVSALLRNGADIHKYGDCKNSPFITASRHGHINVVKLLFDSGAFINWNNIIGVSPLFAASESGHYDVVEYLISSGEDINVHTMLGQSPLYVASQFGHCAVVKCLLSSGADINFRNSDEQSPLFAASRYGYCDVVKCLLSSGADINLHVYGQSPLFVASMYGHCDVVESLLSSGAYINLHCDGKSPLFVASMSGHCDVVKCLLSSSADINLCSKQGQSPLFIASKHGHCDVVKCLLSSVADIKLCSKQGQSPLFIASQYGRCDVVKCLLSSGPEYNLCDEDGQSPLFVASTSGHCDVVKCLLSSSADINLCSKQGQSPLFIASKHGHFDVVKCLIRSGADINLCSKQGQSPLFIASKCEQQCDCFKCLLRSRADINFDINLCDEDEQSPLFLASMSGRRHVKCILKSGVGLKLARKYSIKCSRWPFFEESISAHFHCGKYSIECSRPPCLLASKSGHVGIVLCLFKSGADINLCGDDGESPLFLASEYGKCDVVKSLLSSGVGINLLDKRGQSPLFLASKYGQCDVVKSLLSSGADINLCDNRGQSPLFIASEEGHCDDVKCLLSSGADINLSDEDEQTPLFIASDKGHCDVVKLLFNSGADIKLCNKQEQSPLFIASKYGRCDVVKYLPSADADVNLCDEDGQSPLFIASKHGHCDVVECLLRSGADINLCSKQGQSPLFIASKCKQQCDCVNCLLTSHAVMKCSDEDTNLLFCLASNYGRCDVAKCLLSADADVNLCDEDGQSPLFPASKYGRDVVKCLLSADADVNLCAENGQSPLFIASMSGHCDVVKCLLSSGAKINLSNKQGQSPLFIASMSGHCDVVKSLLSADADVNLCAENGQSPLFIASMSGHCDVVKCLLSSGADINLCDKQGQLPLFVASDSGHYDNVICLLSSGADINFDINWCDKHGQSPLFLASKYRRCDVVEYLLSSGADINLCDNQGQSPLFVASHRGCYDNVICLLSSGADINFPDKNGTLPINAALSSGYYDIVLLLNAHGASCEENVKAQHKAICKGTKDDDSPTDSIALLNLCGYPEEEINHPKEKQEEEKEGTKEKVETILTREKEETEEIIYIRETKEEKEITTEGRKEQTK